MVLSYAGGDDCRVMRIARGGQNPERTHQIELDDYFTLGVITGQVASRMASTSPTPRRGGQVGRRPQRRSLGRRDGYAGPPALDLRFAADLSRPGARWRFIYFTSAPKRPARRNRPTTVRRRSGESGRAAMSRSPSRGSRAASASSSCPGTAEPLLHRGRGTNRRRFQGPPHKAQASRIRARRHQALAGLEARSRELAGEKLIDEQRVIRSFTVSPMSGASP